MFQTMLQKIHKNHPEIFGKKIYSVLIFSQNLKIPLKVILRYSEETGAYKTN